MTIEGLRVQILEWLWSDETVGAQAQNRAPGAATGHA